MNMTSITHPIRVDWLPLYDGKRIGMTFAPGKKTISKYSRGRWERDLDADLARLVAEYSCDILVSLIEEHELRKCKIKELYTKVANYGIQVIRFPIRDVSIRTDGLIELLENIETLATSGKRVVVHCIGGIGRTGMVCGCLLVRSGMPFLNSLATLQSLRGEHCPETSEQRSVIEEFARKHS